MTQAFDPYYKWLGIPPKDQPPNHYRLLGIDLFEQDRDVILSAAEQRIAHVRTFQISQHGELSQRILNELATARVCLLKAEEKADYDNQLREQLAHDHPPSATRIEAPAQPPVDQRRPLIPRATAVVRIAEQPPMVRVNAGGLRQFRRTRRVPRRLVVLVCGFGLATAYWLAKSATVPTLAIVPFKSEEAREHQERWAHYLGREVEETNSIGMRLVLLPPGEFDAGTPEEERDSLAAQFVKPNSESYFMDSLRKEQRRRVTIANAYLLSACEVTVGDFRKFVQATGYKTLAETDGGGAGWNENGEQVWNAAEFSWQNIGSQTITDDLPVVNVAFADAEQFCGWLSKLEGRTYRLPTEDEWEFACRAGTMTPRYFDLREPNNCCWWADNSDRQLRPVGQKLPNAFNLFDMLGNAGELCADRHAAQIILQWRGGHYFCGWFCLRAAYREYCVSAADRQMKNGFRVVCVLSDTMRLNSDPEEPIPAVAPFSAAQASRYQASWAAHLRISVVRTNSIGMKLVLIPPGEFTMGSTAKEIEEALGVVGEDEHCRECILSEAPQHSVVLTQPI